MYKKPFVSITVPIYNSEKQLTRCIESLISQTLKNIEIILVDDGSTDNSGIICDKYASTDARIKVYHQENAGSGAARQLGLEKSTGDYYTVCDSDDWVEPNMYEDLYKKAKSENADIVLSRHYVDYPDGKQQVSPSYQYVNQDKYILDIMNCKASANTWSKLFKLKTIKQYNITYELGINLGEDALFLYKLLLYPLKISTINTSYYHYRRDLNSNSYTNNITLKTVEQNIHVWKWKQKHYTDERYNKAHYFSAINIAFTALRANDIYKEYFSSIANNISCFDIIKFRLFSLKAFLIIATKIFGLDFGRYIYIHLYKYFYK